MTGWNQRNKKEKKTDAEKKTENLNKLYENLLRA
jgi:hypothetical protein